MLAVPCSAQSTVLLGQEEGGVITEIEPLSCEVERGWAAMLGAALSSTSDPAVTRMAQALQVGITVIPIRLCHPVVNILCCRSQAFFFADLTQRMHLQKAQPFTTPCHQVIPTLARRVDGVNRAGLKMRAARPWAGSRCGGGHFLLRPQMPKRCTRRLIGGRGYCGYNSHGRRVEFPSA
jgi:hypothetical protein